MTGRQDRRTAKDLVHLRHWLARAQEIVDCGKDAYLAEPLLQEAGNSLMMKIGEAANRLARAEVRPPRGIDWSDAVGNRNWLIHQYDEIDREITWATLATSLPTWNKALLPILDQAETGLEPLGERGDPASEVMKREPFTAP